MTAPNRNLGLLVPKEQVGPDAHIWATVTQASPLRIKLDGETTALPFAPDSLVTGLVVNDRVLVLLWANPAPASKSHRVVIMGRSESAVPAGTINLFAGASAPTGWLLCDGAAVSRTTYARLFAVIGTTYGAGDGSTTFNVPNLKGRVPVGFDSGQTEFDALGETGGAKTHTLTTAEMPSHSHTLSSITTNVTANASGQGAPDNGGGSLAEGATSGRFSHDTGVSSSTISNTGSGNAHNNLQPYLVMNYTIKV